MEVEQKFKTDSTTEAAAVSGRLELAIAAAKEERKLRLELTKQTMEQSKTYQTTIYGFAYAGFFGIWAFGRSLTLDKGLMALSGAPMTLSIFSFVIFEIFNMFLLQKISRETLVISDLVLVPSTVEEIESNTKRLKERSELFRDEMFKHYKRLMFVWPAFFGTSLISGLVAVALLVYCLFKAGMLA